MSRPPIGLTDRTAEAVLRDFHARRAGGAGRVFQAGPGDSYDRLADAVLGARPSGPVLDLGCGDGLSMERLRARGLEVVGLDMSPEELAAARERLGPEVALVQGRAQSLPFDGGAFGAVASHMAFMLMDDADVVVAEIARVLRPGGSFHAVTGGGRPTGAAADRIFPRLGAELDTVARRPVFGDPRTRTPEGLASLFAGWELEVEEFDLEVEVRERPWDWLQNAFYPVDALPEPQRSRLREWVEAREGELAPGGVMPWTFRLRRISARRPPEPTG